MLTGHLYEVLRVHSKSMEADFEMEQSVSQRVSDVVRCTYNFLRGKTKRTLEVVIKGPFSCGKDDLS